MRKTMLGTVVAAGIALAAPSVAGATHTGGGCQHQRTTQAHQSVPHHSKGNHNAHKRIPYCPPNDTPGHERRAAR